MEIDLLKSYPRTKRDPSARMEGKTEEDIAIARQFGKDYFDGDRRYGYGGYGYHPRFWMRTVVDFIEHYNLSPYSKIMDVGCAKGYMLHDFYKCWPTLSLTGIDISSYAIQNAPGIVANNLYIADLEKLKYFNDDEFDLVVSINTVHNVPRRECVEALSQINRIGKNSFITVDAWRNEEEERLMKEWNLTALTFMHVDDWKKLFKEAGYEGDYYWFIP